MGTDSHGREKLEVEEEGCESLDVQCGRNVASRRNCPQSHVRTRTCYVLSHVQPELHPPPVAPPGGYF